MDDLLLAFRILLALGLYGRAPARAPPRSSGSLFDNIDPCYDADDCLWRLAAPRPHQRLTWTFGATEEYFSSGTPRKDDRSAAYATMGRVRGAPER